LRVSFEHLAESIAAPTLQALGPAMVTMATEVQKAGNYFGSLNQTLVALGGGVAAMAASYAGLKALFGVGGGIFGGFGLKSSAIALDESAAQLTAAAIAIRGGAAADALGHGPGRSPSSLRGRTGLAAGGAAALLANAPGDDDAINKILNDPSQSQFGQAMTASADAIRKVASDLRRQFDELMSPGPEIRRHPGRDVHSPSTGPYSYTPAESAKVSVDNKSLDETTGKAHEAAAAVASLNTVVEPQVDTSTIQHALELADALHRKLSDINGVALRAVASISTPGLLPNLHSTMSGNFTSSGILGE